MVGVLRIVNFDFAICYRVGQVGSSICKDRCCIDYLYHIYLLLCECGVLRECLKNDFLVEAKYVMVVERKEVLLKLG